MKKLILLLFIPLVLGCNDNDKIIVTLKKSSLDCHMCPGYILIEKRGKIDTLEMGGWGHPPNYKLFTHEKKKFIVFENGFFSAGIHESGISILSLNRDNYLNSVYDTLVIDKRITNLKIKRKHVEFIAPDTLLINNHIEIYNQITEGSKKTDLKKEIIILNYLL